MEPATQLAPPVVAVMVVADPGDWFDEVLDGLADQDYANLKNLFLVVGEPGDMPERVRQRVPNAFVRAVGKSMGYGTAANEVLRLVQGENGFFCFLHDDVALDPGAIRLLVEELYRSNAGIVGPKLVSWHDPGVLQHVGLGVDRGRADDHLGAVRPQHVDLVDRPTRWCAHRDRAGGARPGAARRGPRRVRLAVSVPDGSRRPVQGDQRVRHRDRLLR